VKAATNVETCTVQSCAGETSPEFTPRPKPESANLTRFADMLTALGTEPRLRIMQLLLTAHPEGMVVGDIQSELGIAPSTLSHHLEKLKIEDLVAVRRDKKFLWYTANPHVLEELLGFLFSECCSRTKTVRAESILKVCQ
jgi:DNA-binding transcriptional ArsR family regulator